MKKVAAVSLLVLALSGTAFAEGFVKSESDRSGATGTASMLNNSFHGFFASLGKLAPHRVAHTNAPKAAPAK